MTTQTAAPRGAFTGMPISPSELLRDLLVREADPAIIPHIVVGPANKTQIDEGVVELVDAGMPKQEPPGLVWVRNQIRCIGPSLDRVDAMGRHIWEVANWRNRITATMASTSRTYLIHVLKVSAGPSHHWDTAITWESLLFAEMMVGIQPLAATA